MRTKVLVVVFVAGLLTLAAIVWRSHRVGSVSSVAPVAIHPLQIPATPRFPNPSVAPADAAATASTASSLTNLPETIRLILDTKGDALSRQQAAAGLSQHLRPEELRALCDFLATPHDEDATQIGQVLKNLIMNKLNAQDPLPGQLVEVFAGLMRDEHQNEVIRDYAVQHLAELDEEWRGAANSGTAGAEVKAIEAVLWEALEQKQSSLAGTALLGLGRLAREGAQGVNASQVGVAALKLAADATASELTRISALQVCAQLGVKESLPVAVETARSTGSVSLRISALGALGLIGGAPELATVERIAGGKDPRLAPVAGRAAERIRRRL